MQPGLSRHPHARPAPPDDPFQVRPRVNQDLPPGPMYPGHPFPGRSASMHQSQLLSLLQGSNPLTPAPPPPTSHPYPHPSLGPPPPALHTFQHPMSVRGPPPPLHVMPHNLYLPQGLMPASAPALSPTFDVPLASNNSDLLSILNGTKSVTMGSVHGTNIMAPPTISNGVMHR